MSSLFENASKVASKVDGFYQYFPYFSKKPHRYRILLLPTVTAKRRCFATYLSLT